MIDLKYGPLFPWHFRLAAVVGLVFALAITLVSLLGAAIILLICLTVLLSTEGTDVNLSNGTLREYTSILLFKTGKSRPYGQPEKLFITKSTESQRMHNLQMPNHSSVFENVVYLGFLKLSSGEKIKLLRDKDKDQLIKKLSPLSDGLRVDIVDHS
jgi:hypothetical protein